jgi:hypothetical protein
MEPRVANQCLSRIDAVLDLSKKVRDEQENELKKMMANDPEKEKVAMSFIFPDNFNLFMEYLGWIKKSQLDALYIQAKRQEAVMSMKVSSFGSELQGILRRSPQDSEISNLFSDLGCWKSQERVLIAEPNWNQAISDLSGLRKDVSNSKAGHLGLFERQYCRDMPYVKVHAFCRSISD